MKKILFLFIVFSFLFNENVNSQCKFKKIRKAFPAKSDDCSITPDISTKTKKILNKPFQVVVISFAKTGEDYFLYLFIGKQLSPKFEIHKNNSLIFIFESGDPVTLFPCGDFKPRALPLMDCNIGCFYSITKEQIKQITNNGLISSFILHITANKEIPSSQIDEDGTRFLKYNILSENLKLNLSNAATCILSK